MIKEKVKFYPDKEAGDEKGWWWYEGDTGAWDGPRSDWLIHRANITTFVKDYRTALQVGGNLGMYPRLLSKSFERVYTFEPDPLNFYILNLNTPFENIVKIQAALGNNTDPVSMDRKTMTNLGMHQTIEDDASYIPKMRIDSLHIKNLDLLMIDVEGKELEVLQGATVTIEQNSPLIFAERPSRDVIGLLEHFGYKQQGMSMMDGIFTKS